MNDDSIATTYALVHVLNCVTEQAPGKKKKKKKNVLLSIFQNIQNILNIKKYTISYCHMGYTVGNTRNQIKISRCQSWAIVLIARIELAAWSRSLNYGLELPT